MFYVILIGVPALNLLWWWRADRSASRLPKARLWRAAAAAFVLFQLTIYALAIATRALEISVRVPLIPLAAAYIWHLCVLPLSMIAIGLAALGRAASRAATVLRLRLRKDAPQSVEPDVSQSVAPRVFSRRQLLSAAALAAPPLLVGGGLVRALPRLDDFRIRRLDIALPGLPRELDGVTVAHVTDLHAGRFTDDSLLRRVADRVNDLRPDFVAMTGDLIDHDLRELPGALDMLRRMEPKRGLFMCEGNHDLFEDRDAFESAVKSAGIPLLLNEAAEVEISGREVQFLGLKWGRPGQRRDPAFVSHLQETLPLRRPGAFPILLSHHPHVFDAAAAAGIPLTLAGHTHGGQIMATDEVGLAPVAFQYWSGLYEKGNSALVVSNGVGNWFPLRINAPAEIVHLTLRTRSS